MGRGSCSGNVGKNGDMQTLNPDLCCDPPLEMCNV